LHVLPNTDTHVLFLIPSPPPPTPPPQPPLVVAVRVLPNTDTHALFLIPFFVLGEVSVQVCLFAFDLIYLNGESHIGSAFSARRDLLHSTFAPVDGKFQVRNCFCFCCSFALVFVVQLLLFLLFFCCC
jgi:hypothetical protein